MAAGSRINLLSPLLLLLFLMFAGAMVLSARWGASLNLPVRADGSQWIVHVRYGLLRGIIAQPGSELNGQPVGMQLDDMQAWRFEWGVHVVLEGATRIVQIPLWFPALIVLTWLVLRTAGRQLRQSAGKCQVCGRLLDHEGACPRCSQLLPNRPLR